MFAKRSNSTRPSRTVAPRAVMEPLDSRCLMSATVPAGYVQVGTFSLDAYTLGAQTFSVTGGKDYFFKATGTHVLAQNPTRLADAAGYQPTSSTWAAGTHLHVRKDGSDVVNWGATHATDSAYGASYAPSVNATLTAVITDANPDDNSGTLTLDVYQKIVLASLTATEVGGGAATGTDEEGDPALILLTPNGANQATVTLTASYTPTGGDQVLWVAVDPETETIIGSDSFDPYNDSVTFTFPSIYDVFRIRAGVDTNGDGLLQTGEVTRSLIVVWA